MKRCAIVLEINLFEDDFKTKVKVKKKSFTEKEKILLRIALFTLKKEIDNTISKI